MVDELTPSNQSLPEEFGSEIADRILRAYAAGLQQALRTLGTAGLEHHIRLAISGAVLAEARLGRCDGEWLSLVAISVAQWASQTGADDDHQSELRVPRMDQ